MFFILKIRARGCWQATFLVKNLACLLDIKLDANNKSDYSSEKALDMGLWELNW